MGINKVDQKSFSYKLLWYVIKFWHHIVYYQKIEIAHEERVPKTGSVVFTPNHQNALMDALALLFSLKRTVVFLARADIFKKKVFAEILYFLRILPVFRPRDGQGEVKKNMETFHKTGEVLQKNLGLVIFPEGTHTDKQSLLPLKKGFVKIAMQTEESNNFSLGIQLIPIAISYTNYEQCRSTLSINFGEPIDLSAFYDDYREHPAKAFNLVRDQLSESLKQNMIHIEDDEYYESIEYLMMTFTSSLLGKTKQNHRILDGRNFLQRLQAWKEKHKESFEKLHLQTTEFLTLSQGFSRRQQLMAPVWSLTKWLKDFLIFLIFSPLILSMMLIHLPTYLISNLPSIKIKDPQFHSTFRFVIGFLMIPIIYIVEQILFNTICTSIPWYYFMFIYFVSIFLVSQLLNWLRNLKASTRILWYKSFHVKEYQKLHALMTDIQTTIQSI